MPRQLAAASLAKTGKTTHRRVAGRTVVGRLAATHEKFPLRFERNQDQPDSQVKFIARGNGYALFLTPVGPVLELQGHGTGSASKQGRASGNLQQSSGRQDGTLTPSHVPGREPVKSLAEFLQSFQSPRNNAAG